MTRPRHTGFTLLEVMAALLVLSTAIFAALQVQSQALRNVSRTKRYARCLAAAQTAMDRFLADPVLPALNFENPVEETVTLDAYEDDGFEIRRTIVRRDPLFEQDALVAEREYPDEAAWAQAQLRADRAAQEPEPTAEEIFDPGWFLAVTFEVWDPTLVEGNTHPVVRLATWIPRPMSRDEEILREEELGNVFGYGDIPASGSTGGSPIGAPGGGAGLRTRGGQGGRAAP